ncbi:MAG: nitronate monooxygenase [Alphaproteobacteria bacterium]|nr:nitronate monooxygenase [Alphaproteobacteria bacterium]MBF0250936.1 nitronate monooxygenase [Alphaproteobacteria bacterium]
MKALNAMNMSGKDVLPLIEGGKGVAVSTGLTAGAWAKAGGIGTISCTNADSFDADGRVIPQIYHGKTRSERFEELKAYAIEGGVEQARVAHETAGGEGRIHINVLWEAGGTIPILHGIMERAGELINGITCGAGMPYKVAEIAAQYGKHYYPIVSSGRAFNALWKRSYKNHADLLGGVVYEDPWRAGGHNGLSNSENPDEPQDPMPRVLELRQVMNTCGLEATPIVMAGGVWFLRDWQDWIDNPELGPIAFQYGTRPLLTQESPIAAAWKQRLLALKEGDVMLNRFSPTGFYSSAIKNPFLEALEARSARQVDYRAKADADDGFTAELPLGPRGRPVFLRPDDLPRAQGWIAQGFTEGMKTPDSTLVFETPEKAQQIVQSQGECMCCLSQCRFSNWADNAEGTNGKRADPRSFCIQKALQRAAHGGDLDQSLMFAGHNAYMFGRDPFYANGFIPTVKQLVDRIVSGD